METDGKERQEEEGKDEPGLTPQVSKLCLLPGWLLNFFQTIEVNAEPGYIHYI